MSLTEPRSLAGDDLDVGALSPRGPEEVAPDAAEPVDAHPNGHCEAASLEFANAAYPITSARAPASSDRCRYDPRRWRTAAASTPSRLPNPLGANWSPTADRLRWALVAVGALLRLREYAANRSLWRDEASLVYNVLHRGWLGFDHPLDFNQGTPPGFFVIEHAVASIFGSTELALRAPALLASVLALVVMAVLVRRELDATTGLVALALFAGATALIEYGNEVKQYSLDVLVALLIALVVSYAWRAHLDRRWCIVLGATGASAVWFAHITPFVLVAAGATLAWVPLRQRDLAVLRRLALVGSAWFASWLVLYLWLLRNLGDSSFLRTYWQDAFLPIPPHDSQGLERWHAVLSSTSTLVTGRSAVDLLVAVVAVIGVVRLARQQKGVLAMAVGPWIAVVVASAFELYPAAERMVLFVVPGLAVLLGAGVADVVGRLRRTAPLLATAVAVIFVLLCSAAGLGRLATTTTIEEQRPLITTLGEDALPGDAAYVTETAEPAFDYYADQVDLDLDPVVIGRAPFTDADAIEAELAPLRGRPRVWIVTSAFWRPEGDLSPALTTALDRMGGVRLEQHDGPEPRSCSTTSRTRPPDHGH